MHVLCFNPYVRWTLHGARQAAILQGLHLRNTQITMVLCDGLMPECDLYQPAKGDKAKRTGKSCNRCQAESSYLTAKNNLAYLWLGRWLEPDIIAKAHAFAAEVADPSAAVYNDWPIGAWVKSSVHSHYRRETLDLEDADTETTYRRYVAGGIVIASAFDALLTHEKPDAQLLFNGRMAPTRIALELAKLHGVRTITEERGSAPGHLRLVENTHCLDPKPFYALSAAWQNTPLNLDERTALENLLDKHFSCSDHEMSLFAAPVQGTEYIKRQLSIQDNAKLAVLFTSSTDEPSGQPEAVGSFDHQGDWVRETIAEFSHKPDWTLIVRSHPNSGGKRSVGDNASELTFIESLQENCPNNVVIVKPEDEISSYDLIKTAHCGLIWHSSLGIEIAATGRPVFRAGNYWFRDTRFMTQQAPGFSYSDSLSQFLAEADSGRAFAATIDATVAAWRFAYCWFFRQSIHFPLVRQPTWATGEAAYNSLEALQPGRDPSLDRVCDIILGHAPVHIGPHARSQAGESEERAHINAFVQRFATT